MRETEEQRILICLLHLLLLPSRFFERVRSLDMGGLGPHKKYREGNIKMLSKLLCSPSSLYFIGSLVSCELVFFVWDYVCQFSKNNYCNGMYLRRWLPWHMGINHLNRHKKNSFTFGGVNDHCRLGMGICILRYLFPLLSSL